MPLRIGRESWFTRIWSCRLTAESAVFFSGTACRLFYDIQIRIS
jgi:hypothetical protein